MYYEHDEKNVSPSMAEKLILGNHGNRKVRKSHVDYLARQMAEGEYKFTPQPIIIHEPTGRVLDGQHRLYAVISSKTKAKFVFSYAPDDSIFPYIDKGIARSSSDSLQKDSRLIETSTFMAFAAKSQKPTISEVEKIANVIYPTFELLNKSTCTYFSTSPMRAAAVIQDYFSGGNGYSIEAYSRLVSRKYSAMTEIESALVRKHNSEKLSTAGAVNQIKGFGLGYVAFDKTMAKRKKNFEIENQESICIIRKFLEENKIDL